MAFIVTVLQTKGGVGKTTTALNIAAGLQLAGHDVLAVDADDQSSLAAAISNRPDSHKPLAVTRLPDPKALLQQIPLAAGKYDFIVIDVAGRNSKSLRVAAGLSDLVLVPVVPRAFDLWALDDTVAALDEVRCVKPQLPAVAFVTMADPRGQDNADAADLIHESFEKLDFTIGRRKAISTAAQEGLGILEVPDADEKAVFEINRLVKFVLAKTAAITA